MCNTDHSMSTACKLLVLTALQFVVALVFLKGFLLTRVELPDVAQCQGSSCSSKLPTYQKAVVLIVDAVRYDFLCGKQSESGQLSGSLMPRTLRWVQTGVRACLLLQLLKVVHCPTTSNPPADWTAGSSAAATLSKMSSLHHHVVCCHCVVQAGAAVASRFVADTPTITMSRLKALLTVRRHVCSACTAVTALSAASKSQYQQLSVLQAQPTGRQQFKPNSTVNCCCQFATQGGLPTFLDIGQSFSASAITEDNLLQQLLARNKTLVGCLARQERNWKQVNHHPSSTTNNISAAGIAEVA